MSAGETDEYDLLRIPRRRPTGVEDHEAWDHAHAIIQESRRAFWSAGEHWARLRMMTRWLQGKASLEDVARRLGWKDEDRAEWAVLVEHEVREWIQDDRAREPLTWFRPDWHRWVSAARRHVEAADEKRGKLRTALLVRLQAAGGRWTEREAAAHAGLSLGAWQHFCAVEDASTDDHAYREGWIVTIDAAASTPTVEEGR